MDPEAARAIIAQLPPFVAAVGVFVDEEAAMVRDLAAQVGLDWVQLHGQESPEYCRGLGRKVIKGFRIRDEKSLLDWSPTGMRSRPFSLDTYKKGQVGGTGEVFDWRLAREAENMAGSSWPEASPRRTSPRPSPPPSLMPWTRPAAPKLRREKRPGQAASVF